MKNPDTSVRNTNPPLQKVRLDKWLWAARLFKTRSLAKQAIEGGKINCDDQKVKPGKEISIGTVLAVRQGWDEKILLVKALSEQRAATPRKHSCCMKKRKKACRSANSFLSSANSTR
jgi:ribosomal 50S subunit-recycling heat shock protein